MVGWKIILILFATLFLLLLGLTGGRFLSWVLPHSDIVIGQFCCKIGGFIFNPVLEVGPLKIPYLDSDGSIVASLITTALAIWVYRHFIKSIKWFLVAILITWILFFFIYKLIGAVLVWIAEVKYGLTGCIEFIDLGILRIEYGWFSPLFLLGAGLSLIGLILTIIKLTKGMKK